MLSDGVQALDYLYCRGEYQGRDGGHPVVMLSSSREERDLAECYKMGTNAYAVKPVDFQQFVHVMKHLGTFWALVNELPRHAQPLSTTHATERTP